MASQAAYSKVSVEDGVTGDSVGNLQESLVTIPSSTVATSTVPMLQVTAPADLPEGYEMEATIGGTEDGQGGTGIQVQVPPGGIEKGQTFSVPFPSQVQSRLASSTTIRVPVGNWRDGMFEFYKYGVCHPHCWTACCCTTLAAGQVISRMGLDWTGKPARSPGQAAAAFSVVLGIVIVYYMVRVPLAITNSIIGDYDDDEEERDDQHENGEGDDDDDDDDDDGIVFLIIMIWFCLFWIIMAVLLARVRSTVRERYGIPPSCLGETLDDPAVSCCCCCFAAGQMLRHTTDYETYPSTCCTRTGIPPTAPSIV